MTRPDPNIVDVTLARVAHSDYIWSAIRMITPKSPGELIEQVDAAAIAYTMGCTPGAAA